MTPEEAVQMCRMARSISPAQAVDDYTPAAWGLVLVGTSFEDAKKALGELGAEQEWIHVSHIVKRVKKIRADRVARFGLLTPPAELADDPRGQIEWRKVAVERVASGEVTAADVQAGKQLTEAEVLREIRDRGAA